MPHGIPRDKTFPTIEYKYIDIRRQNRSSSDVYEYLLLYSVVYSKHITKSQLQRLCDDRDFFSKMAFDLQLQRNLTNLFAYNTKLA